MKIRWQEPGEPPRDRSDVRPGKWKPALEQLRSHPGEWGVIYEYDQPSPAYNLVRNLRRGFLVGSREQGFQFLARKDADKNGEAIWLVFGRYTEE